MSVSGNGPGGGNNDTGRIEAFSDGVFAIAITLLVIEIGVPHVGSEESLSAALVKQWPSYLGYAISFVTIGIVWANHHNRFRYIVRSNHILLFLNTLFLMCVAFIPFPTALLAEYIKDPEYQTTVVAVYSGVWLVASIFFVTLWLYASSDYRLLDRSLSPGALRVMTRRYVVGTLLFVVTFALSFVSAKLALTLIIGLDLTFMLPEPGGSPQIANRKDHGPS